MDGMRIKPVTPDPGALIGGRYRVERALGKGGMGLVIAVHDESTGEPLALKLLAPLERDQESTADTSERAARLLREARATMRLVSPHVVRVRDVCVGVEAGPFLVMDRLEGQDLADLCPLGHKMPWRDVADVAIQVCEALRLAHAAGIIHRDVKPSNLFVAESPEGPIVKVLDFGISKVTTRAEWERTSTLTDHESVLGSPQFLSPEHLREPRGVDARTDIWSLGVVMYRLLSGAYPFVGETMGELFVHILERDARPLEALGVELPAELSRIVARCLERDRGDRYASIAELGADLAPLVSERWALLGDQMAVRGRTTARPPSMAEVSTRPPSQRSAPSARGRSRTTVLVVGAAVVLGSLGIARVLRTGATAPMTTPAPSAVVLSSAPESSAAPSSDVVELTLSADAPIEKVRAPGLRRVSLEGGRAIIVVTPWVGTLSIDAELAGGVLAQGAAHASGRRDVTLTAVVGQAAPSLADAALAAANRGPTLTAAPPPSPSSPSSPSARAPIVLSSATASSSASLPVELHANPYARTDAGAR